jgi:uncharacterized damage-inducible protein DinB
MTPFDNAQGRPEVWLRGQFVAGVPALLQPVAHSLLQCRAELAARLEDLTPDQIWMRPGGVASIGFHARHAAGSLDRLFTYARGDALTADQLAALSAESEPDRSAHVAATLIGEFDRAVDRALAQLRTTSDTTLTSARRVGRAQLPSTVIGLLFHAAEHAQRHLGQMVTTVKVLAACP